MELRYNSSITKFNDKLYYADRVVKKGGESSIEITQLSEDLKPITKSKLLDIPNPVDKAVCYFEDPRLFVFDEKLCCAYTNFNKTNAATNIGICVLDQKLKIINVIYPNYGFNHNGAILNKIVTVLDCGAIHTVKPHSNVEKNWQFFQHGNSLLAAYSINPHVIIDVSLSNANLAKQVAKTEANIIWPYGELRGGTPPILVNDEYFSFFHSSYYDESIKKKVYVMGLYVFEAVPPFAITKISKIPLAIGDSTDPKAPKHFAVVFPCGAIFDGTKWIVSCGINDYKSEFLEFNHKALLENNLTKVSSMLSSFHAKQ